MAEKIKFRLTAAKVGVSVALLALIGGVVERFRAGPAEVHITPASSPGQFLKLGGITGNVKTALIKLEDKWIKLDTALTDVVHKLSTDYLKIDKADAEFLKIDKAASEFLTIKSSGEFLKIDKASTEYMKIVTADAKFLALQKADAAFVKIQTARNEFLQGHGGVVSAAAPVLADGSVTKLLSSPDGSLTVTLSESATNGQIIVVCDNNTGLLLPAVMVLDGSVQKLANLQPGPNRIPLGALTTPHQLQLQTFGDGSAKEAMTLTLSTEGTPGKPGAQAVGQMLIGLL
jgi:hypothetical protein